MPDAYSDYPLTQPLIWFGGRRLRQSFNYAPGDELVFCSLTEIGDDNHKRIREIFRSTHVWDNIGAGYEFLTFDECERIPITYIKPRIKTIPEVVCRSYSFDIDGRIEHRVFHPNKKHTGPYTVVNQYEFYDDRLGLGWENYYWIQRHGICASLDDSSAIAAKTAGYTLYGPGGEI